MGTIVLLTKDQILAAPDLPTRDIEVPEWGGTVRVKSLKGKEREQYEQSILVGPAKNRTVNMIGMRAKLVAAAVIDENGKKIFNEDEVMALAEKSAKALERVFSVAGDLSGLGEDEVKKLAEDLKVAQSKDSHSS